MAHLDRGGGSIMLLTIEEYQELLKKSAESDRLFTENNELRKEICLLQQERDKLIVKVNKQKKELAHVNIGMKKLRQSINKG
jgi:hypothetical protein